MRLFLALDPELSTLDSPLRASCPFGCPVDGQNRKSTAGARGIFHFVRGCSLPTRANSLAGLRFDCVHRVRNSIRRDELRSFCPPKPWGRCRYPEDQAIGEGQNGGSFCPLLSNGAARMISRQRHDGTTIQRWIAWLDLVCLALSSRLSVLRSIYPPVHYPIAWRISTSFFRPRWELPRRHGGRGGCYRGRRRWNDAWMKNSIQKSDGPGLGQRDIEEPDRLSNVS